MPPLDNMCVERSEKKRKNVSATIEFRSLGISFSELIIILRYLYLIWR